MELTDGQAVVVFQADGRRSQRYPGRVATVKRVNVDIDINIGTPAEPRWLTRTFRMSTRKEPGSTSSYGWSYQMPGEVERSDRLHAAREALKAVGIQEKWPHSPELTLEQLEQLAAVAATFTSTEETS
jgi:hypothetical protein